MMSCQEGPSYEPTLIEETRHFQIDQDSNACKLQIILLREGCVIYPVTSRSNFIALRLAKASVSVNQCSQ